MRKILFDRTEYYNEAGQLHREDGPAIECSDGYKAWWVNGKFHRLDGPAIECSNGSKVWYINGQLHRLDGPARERSNGAKEWWVNGENLSEQDFKQHPLVLEEKQRKHDLELPEYFRVCREFHKDC